MTQITMEEKGESRSGSVAPDGGRSRSRTDSPASVSSSSSSAEDERLASPPPNKRRKYSEKPGQFYDSRVDALATQVNYIANYIAHNLPVSSVSSQQQSINLPGTSSQNGDTLRDPFLTIPSSTTSLSLGEVNIDLDENRIVPPANPERLRELQKLQHFDTQAWVGIRYKKAMKKYMASPGFIGLKVNEELCHFNKNKDYILSTENLVASLCNAVLEQRHLMQESLQGILDWASTEPAKLNIHNLFERFSVVFGPGSVISKNSEAIMQLLCGKRSECIELRRAHILGEVGNPNLRATLRDVPPSSEYLFSREALKPIIQSLGGSQTWLNTPTYLMKKKPHRSNSSYDQNSFKRHSKHTNNKNVGFKNNQKSRPIVKKPFRRNNNPEQSNAHPKQN